MSGFTKLKDAIKRTRQSGATSLVPRQSSESSVTPSTPEPAKASVDGPSPEITSPAVASSAENGNQGSALQSDLKELNKLPPAYLYESDIVMNDAPNPRLVESDKRLLKASRELLHALRLYSSSRDGNAVGFAELPDEPDTSSSVEDVRKPEKLSSLVDKILTEQINQKASISSRFGSVISKLYPLVSLTLGIGSAIAEGAIFVPVKGAVNGLSLLLAIADQEHTKSTDFLKQLDRISFQALRVAEVTKAGADINDLLLEKATDLVTAILVFFKGSLLYLKHDFFHHVLKGILLGPRVYADAKAELDNAINEYDQTLLLQVTLKAISARPTEHQSESGPTTSDLVSWLQPSRWEVESEFARHCRSRAEGTFEWIFKVPEFKEWRLGSLSQQGSRSRSRSLWLTGLPGVGKSTIAAYIIEALQIQHPQASVLYFFCKSGDSNLSTLPQLVRTLAAQLVPEIPTVRSHLQTLKEKDFKISNPDSLFLYQNLIRDSLKESSKEIFIVIDGLDECSIESQQPDLEALLTSLSSLDVKLLVSSRVTAEISSGLSNAQKRELTYEDSHGDIQLYILHCVAKSKNLEEGFQMLGMNPSEFLSEKSHGNFLWVKLVLEALKWKTSEKDFQQVIDTLPKDLEGVYEQVLQRLESRGSLKLALTIFRCVLYSRRPLTIAEMEVAVGLITEDNIFRLVNFVESESGSILRQTPSQPANVYIVHETFRSFITSKSASKENCVAPSSSHLQLLVACIRCLLEPDSATFAPFRKYAVSNWLDHFVEVFKDLDTVSADEVRVLLFKLRAFFVSRSAVRTWMRDFVFDSTEQYYSLATLIASFHNIVLEFLRSDRVCYVATSSTGGPKQEGDGDADWKEVQTWRDWILSSGQPTYNIRIDFYHVWLNTNWRELDLAKWVVRAAMHLDHVLKHMPDSQHKMETRGWKSWYPLHDLPRTIVDTVENVAALADFNDQAGIQVGNYAFGLLVADSEECVCRFQDALDEYPEYWHLHEGLAEYYADHDQREKAIASLEKALKADTKEYPSAAFTHATLVAKAKEDANNLDEATEALKEGLKRSPEKDAYKYWDAMAKIFEERRDGNRMVEIYKEAVKKHPKAGKVFWEKLADTYGRGGAREQQWHTYREATDKDPENRHKYGEEIQKIAQDLTDLCVWQPVPVVLTNGGVEDPDNAIEYYRQLGGAYMCQRKWKEALVEFEKYAEKAEDKWVYKDIGHGYLGLGDTAKSLTAYEMAFSESTAVSRARSMGYVHIIDGNYTQAIRLFKAALSQLASKDYKELDGFNFGQVDDSKEQRSFQLHLQLGLCYEATSRPDDMKRHLEAAVSALKPIAMEMDKDRDRELVYRHQARSLFHVGLVQEKLGLREDAKQSLDRAVFLFEKTTMEGDDELQQSEAEEAAAALARVSNVDNADEVVQLPDLKEMLGSMRLQRRLALPYTTDWYCSQSWKPPRRRGARKWNEVSFVNKFKITTGDRTFIMPWGFGHT